VQVIPQKARKKKRRRQAGGELWEPPQRGRRTFENGKESKEKMPFGNRKLIWVERITKNKDLGKKYGTGWGENVGARWFALLAKRLGVPGWSYRGEGKL